MSDKHVESFGDVYTGLLLKAYEDKLDIVRAMCEDVNGNKFEMIGVDRGEGEIVPLFLVPIGGAQTLIDDYKLVKGDASEVNPFTIDATMAH
jgi:hypothetical protein